MFYAGWFCNPWWWFCTPETVRISLQSTGMLCAMPWISMVHVWDLTPHLPPLSNSRCPACQATLTLKQAQSQGLWSGRAVRWLSCPQCNLAQLTSQITSAHPAGRTPASSAHA